MDLSEIAQLKFTEVGERLFEKKKQSVWKWEGPVSRKRKFISKLILVMMTMMRR
jgi:hypothetical protein